MAEKSDIGLIGLAVMGENLVLNMAGKGYSVSVFNRTYAKVEKFLEGRAQGKTIRGFADLKAFCNSLSRPRKVMMMVKAGAAVDSLIESLQGLLEPGDILIDGGNSHYPDTQRRYEKLRDAGIHFVGTGVSGGEEGALHGPSIMPGGAPSAWAHIRPIFQGIAAKVDDGTPCCDWVGSGGAGHFVKMVHNGIEYGDMQLIAESWDFMRKILGLTNAECAEVFKKWDGGKLDSYLIEITAEILETKRPEGEGYVVDDILDAAGQKGTGKWTAATALEMGIPVTAVAEAVFARCLSSLKALRIEAANTATNTRTRIALDREGLLADLEAALYASKIISYAQGFSLMRAAGAEYDWSLNYGGIALMWRGGCIIRSTFLGRIKQAFETHSDLENLVLDPFFGEELKKAEAGWRSAVSTAVLNGLPLPAMSSALAYYDGLLSADLPANLIQAQRDYFGAHTYERKDKPRGQFFHTNWTGEGGDTVSTAYIV